MEQDGDTIDIWHNEGSHRVTYPMLFVGCYLLFVPARFHHLVGLFVEKRMNEWE